MNIEDKVAIVTGAASGIGRAVAAELVASRRCRRGHGGPLRCGQGGGRRARRVRRQEGLPPAICR